MRPRGPKERALLVVTTIVAASVTLSLTPPDAFGRSEAIPSIRVTAPAFSDGGKIPARYTCDGDGWSPALRWSDLPADTQSVAVLVDDPDASSGTFANWVLYDLTPTWGGLAEGANLGDSGTKGKNGNNRVGWTPPCPGHGKHHYRFQVFALRAPLVLREPPREGELLRVMQDLVVARGELVGTYERTKR